MNFDWGLFFVEISVDQLEEFNVNMQMSHVMNRIQAKLDSMNNPNLEYHPFYPFNSNYILKQIFNWEFNTTIQFNRKYDMFILHNQSFDSLEDKNKVIYVHGSRFKHFLRINNEKGGSKYGDVFEVPFLR